MMDPGSPTADSDYREGLVHKMKTTIHKMASLASYRHRGSDSATGPGGTSHSAALGARPVFAALALLAAVAAGFLLLMHGGPLHAQEVQRFFTYVENGTEPVATFTARDPEGVTPIVWSLLAVATGDQDLGIFTDSNNDNIDDSADDVVDTDIADRALFDISQDGVLTFKDPPSFEGMSDSGDDNYRVVVQASDGGSTEHLNWFKVTVNVTDEEEGGKLARWTVDPDGTGTTEDPGQDLRQFNADAVLTAPDPTDPDGGVTNIQWKWYRSSSASAQGELIDGANDNEYTVVDTPADPNDVGKYLRVEATYSDARGPGKTASYVSENPVQAARDDNTVPKFFSTTITREVTENSKGNVGGPIRATDDDGDLVTYSMVTGGADNASFTIDRVTGQLKVASGTTLDFESPADTGDTANNNTYVVTIRATDSLGGDSNDVTVTVTVTDLNEEPTFGAVDAATTPPANTVGMAGDIMEDGSLDIATYTASDPEGGEVTLSLEGDDAAMFELAADSDTTNAVSRVLSFSSRPDFEMPGDSNSDNIYEVTVVASDGPNTAMRSVTVKVTDADEEGKVKLSSQDALIGVELTATLTDSDGGVPGAGDFTDQKWQWHRLDAATDTPGTAAPNDNDIAGATSAAYTPKVADRGKFLVAMVTYTDRTRDEDNTPGNNDAGNNFVGFENTVTSDPTTAVRNNPANQAPKFKEGASTYRVVEENTKALTGTDDDDAIADDPADNVGGGPVEATDADNDTPTYTLGGADKDMFRVRANGQIEVSSKANLDHEASSTHTVTLTADDGFGAPNSKASITVTIYVTDLDERPVINDKAASAAIGEQSVEYAENRDDAVLTLTARDPEGVTPIVWSLLAVATGDQDLGIFTDSNNDNIDDSADDVVDTDIADRALFDISQDGVLTFKDPPSFEGMSDSGDDNYRVVVQASDGGSTEHLNWFKVTVNVTDEEEGGKLARWTVDPDGTGTTEDPGQDLRQFNADAKLTVADPTDPDGGVTNIQWKWYRSSSASAQGELIDGANDNEYTVVDTPADPNDVGKYLRVEATYTDARGPDKTASYVSENPVQATRDDNTVPEFPSTGVARRIAENSKGNIGGPIRATDDDGDLVTYSVAGSGADNASFTIDRVTGQLKVASGTTLDFESPADTGDTANNNTYVVTIRATDSSGGDSADVTVTVTVTDLNEKPTFGAVDAATTPPANTVGMAGDIMEDGSLDIATYTASDPEGGEVTLSLEGDDAAMFELAADSDTTNAVSRVLSFSSRPDFEMPGDSNSDNIYEVTVVASDGPNTAMRSVTVKVTDADEEGKVKLSSQDALIGVELTATLTDSDGGVPGAGDFTDQKWQWHRLDAATDTPGTAAPNDNDIAGATSAAYTPKVADRGKFLVAMVTYTDRTRDEDNTPGNNDAGNNFVGFENTVTSDPTTAVRNNPANQAPKFKEGASTYRVVEENTKALTGTDDDDAIADDPADNVGGGPVEATDADGGMLTYTLDGADKDMFRVRANGQIEVSSKANLDHEASSTRTVTLTATDTSGEANDSATITVTIYVTDLDEQPVISTGVSTPSRNNAPAFDAGRAGRTVAENTPAGRAIGGPVAATDADAGDTLVYSLGGADAASFNIDRATGQLRTKATLDFETKASYTVTVTATDDVGADDSIEVTITVTDVDEVVPETPLERYDANENGRIDKEELAEAVFDYNINETLEKADLADLIFSYEIG